MTSASPARDPATGTTSAARAALPKSTPNPGPTSSQVASRGAVLRLQREAGNRAIAPRVGHWASLTPQLARAVAQRSTEPVVQRRRVPATVDALIAPGAVDQAAHHRGLLRVLRRSLLTLSSAQLALVRDTAVLAVGTEAAFDALLPVHRYRMLSSALRIRHPELVLGDPALINIGPRPGTLDAANIGAVVAAAAAVMGALAGGARPDDLRDVFGAADAAAASARYLGGVTRMNELHAQGRIVTDRSGYNREVGLGGLTNANRISVAPQVIDNPSDQGSVVTMIHEAMHAGNPGVNDRGYLGTPSFRTMSALDKLGNAAHYEVPARRILGMSGAYHGIVFVPAGTSVVVGGVTHTAATLTPIEQAARDTSELLRTAWNMGLNMHNLWVRINLNRADWTGLVLSTQFRGAVAAHFHECMPFWSKVQGLTVHERAGLSAVGADPTTAPVTQADVALSEGMVRLLMRAKDIASAELQTASSTTTFLAAHTTATQRAAATTVARKTLLLLRSIRDKVGEITGSPVRDVRVFRRMGTAPAYSDMLVPRSPASFP